MNFGGRIESFQVETRFHEEENKRDIRFWLIKRGCALGIHPRSTTSWKRSIVYGIIGFREENFPLRSWKEENC